eukprot:TRINITY_DN47166_c0_g1_i1.p1 TRINITY_DN47166_c0_g1~~TRINITY_DN47166_c0_g1_i1.p1  ORF type:complete len:112 (+),score=8.60 TRINITY_DN47166_c0_g1_i1:109-444(+)
MFLTFSMASDTNVAKNSARKTRATCRKCEKSSHQGGKKINNVFSLRYPVVGHKCWRCTTSATPLVALTALSKLLMVCANASKAQAYDCHLAAENAVDGQVLQIVPPRQHLS